MKILSSSRPSDPESFLIRIRENSSKLDLFVQSLEIMEQEFDEMDVDDPRKLAYQQRLLQSKYTLSKQFTMLAIIKAQNGIVGLSWYKSNDPQENDDD
jgi:enoyl-[acyl-carrier-protein] reductase (NADH)